MKAPPSSRNAQIAYLASSVVATIATIAVGRGAPAPAFIVLVAATFAAFALLVWSLDRARWLSPRILVGACIGLTLVAIAIPVRSSRDVYSYIMYGRIVAQHHTSPYTHVPSDFPNDPALARVQPVFRNTGSVYGPVFTGVSAAGMGACGSSPVCGRVFFQLLEALAVLGSAWLVLRRTKSWAAAACIAFNPALLITVVNGAHPDGLVALGVLAAVLFVREQPVLAGVFLGASVLVKINALLPALIILAWLLLRDDKRKALIAGATTGVLVIGGYLIAGGTAALKPLHTAAEYVSFHSFWYPIERLVAYAFELHGNYQARFASVALIIVIVIACAIAAGARDDGPAVGTGLALSVYVLAAPYVLPWYTAPAVVMLALHPRARTTWLINGYAMSLHLLYSEPFPAHRTFMGLILPEAARNVLPVVQVLMLFVIAYGAWLSRPQAETGRALDKMWSHTR